MTIPPPDGSRDRRIEDPTNLWLIHPAGRLLLPQALRLGVSANAVSLTGLVMGAAAAFCYSRWTSAWAVLAGLFLSICWLILDGLDGMVARATGTASPLGRFLDGVCDHGVFLLIYVALAASIGTAEAWALAIVAGAAHGVQSSLYEGERYRFHRRARGVADVSAATPSGNLLVRGYDYLAGTPGRLAVPFEQMLANAADPQRVGALYATEAAPAMRLMALLSANCRVLAVALACLAGAPSLFWWCEIVPLTAIALLAMARHRAVERSFVRPASAWAGEGIASIMPTKEHRHS